MQTNPDLPETRRQVRGAVSTRAFTQLRNFNLHRDELLPTFVIPTRAGSGSISRVDRDQALVGGLVELTQASTQAQDIECDNGNQCARGWPNEVDPLWDI